MRLIHAFNADMDVVQTSVKSTGGLGGWACKGRGYDVGSRFAGGGIRTATVTQVSFGLAADSNRGRTGRTHRNHPKCCGNDASRIPLHPQLPKHRSMKDWSVSSRQIVETTKKKKGVANDCVTGERERLSLLHFTYGKHWDKWG